MRSKTLSLLAAAVACSACASMRRKAPPAAPAPAVVSQAAVPAAPAAAPTPAPAAVAMPTGKTHKMWAAVTSVDAAAGTLTVRDHHGRSQTLRLASGAKITKGGDQAAIALSAVKAGDRVTLRVADDVAASVHVNVLTAKAK